MKNVSVVGKLMAVMAVVGLFTTFLAVFVSGRMLDVDRRYSRLIDHQEQAAMAVSRGNRNAQSLRATIAELAMSRTDQDNARIEAELGSAKAHMQELLGQAVALDPSHRPQIDSLREEVSQLVNTGGCGRAEKLAAVSTSDADVLSSQAVYMQACARQFSVITEHFVAMTD